MKNNSLSDLGLFLVRLLAGGMMLTHGVPKFDRLFGEGPVKFADPFWARTRNQFGVSHLR